MTEKATHKVILLNGLPATGKTTIGRAISQYLHAPLITLDTLKEAMFDELGVGDRDYNRMLSRTCKKIIWAMISEFPDDAIVIVDAWFGRAPHDAVIHSIEASGVSQFVEIWCHAPGAILKERYIARVGERHPGHPGVEYGDELEQIASEVAPMCIGPSYSVDTSDLTSVEMQPILDWIVQELKIKPPVEQ